MFASDQIRDLAQNAPVKSASNPPIASARRDRPSGCRSGLTRPHHLGLGHDHSIGASAATLSAPEAQATKRDITAPSVYQRLQVRIRLVMAGCAADVQPQELRREHATRRRQFTGLWPPPSSAIVFGRSVAIPLCHQEMLALGGLTRLWRPARRFLARPHAQL